MGFILGCTLTLVSFVTGSVPPTMLTTNFNTQYVKPGSTAREKCEAKGDPNPTYIWEKDGVMLSNNGQYEIEPFLGTIAIRYVTVLNGEGTYQCFAQNSHGTARSGYWEVKVASMSGFKHSMIINTTVDEYSYFSMPCKHQPNSVPASTTLLNWKTGPNGIVLRLVTAEDKRRFVLDADGTLHFIFVRASDEIYNPYRCALANTIVDATTVSLELFTLNVRRLPEEMSEPVLKYSKSVEGKVGSWVKLLCIFAGNPIPTVEWLKEDVIISDGSLLYDGKPKYSIYSCDSTGRQLIIDMLEIHDQGDYICRAKNDFGNEEGTVRLTVTFPEMNVKPNLIYSNALQMDGGTFALLVCVFAGSPKPEWRKDDVIIHNGSLLPDGKPKYIISHCNPTWSYLLIDNLKIEDQGDYICQAKNDYGIMEGNVRVTVTGHEVYSKPVLVQSNPVEGKVGSMAKLLCIFEGNPIPTVEWSKDDVIISDEHFLPNGQSKYKIDSRERKLLIYKLGIEDQGDYTCRAKNTYGVDEGTVRVTVTGITGSVLPLIPEGKINESLELTCLYNTTSSSNIHSVVWYVDNDTVGIYRDSVSCEYLLSPPSFNKTRYNFTCNISSNTFNLNILALDKSDNGQCWRCKLTFVNSAGTEIAGPACIALKDAPDVTVKVKGSTIIGSTGVLMCTAQGEQRLYTFHPWIHRVGQTEIRRLNGVNKDSISILTLSNISIQDMGSYICTVDNSITGLDGQLYQTGDTSVYVQGPPVFGETKGEFVREIGKAASIEIPYYSSSFKTTMKFHKGSDLSEISNTSDVYFYNSPSNITLTFHTVKVMIPGHVAGLFFKHVTETDFGSYKLQLSNAKGSVTMLIACVASGPPSAPKSFSFKHTEDNFLVFDLVKGFNGGHEQMFVIEYKTVGNLDENWSIAWKSSESNLGKSSTNETYYIKIPKLRDGVYTFRVYAENEKGRSSTIEDIYAVVKKDINIGPLIGLAIALLIGIIISCYIRKKIKSDSRMQQKKK